MHELVGDEDILSKEEVPGQEHIITITHWMELECTVGVAGVRYKTLKMDHDKILHKIKFHISMIWGIRATPRTR